MGIARSVPVQPAEPAAQVAAIPLAGSSLASGSALFCPQAPGTPPPPNPPPARLFLLPSLLSPRSLLRLPHHHPRGHCLLLFFPFPFLSCVFLFHVTLLIFGHFGYRHSFRDHSILSAFISKACQSFCWVDSAICIEHQLCSLQGSQTTFFFSRTRLCFLFWLLLPVFAYYSQYQHHIRTLFERPLPLLFSPDSFESTFKPLLL